MDAWHPHVLPGGVVAFHDARSGHPGGPHPWPGPTAVVDALFRGEGALAEWRIVGETGSLVGVERRLRVSEARARSGPPVTADPSERQRYRTIFTFLTLLVPVSYG